MDHIIKIRLLVWGCLVFSFLIMACRNDKAGEVILGWEEKQPRKMLIPLNLFPEKIDHNSMSQIRVSLATPGSPAMLGNYDQNDQYLIFEPLIPFTRGLKYEVQYKESKLASIEIPRAEGKEMPVITAVYPNTDSLPGNLLKIYIAFSQPMQEGVSAQHIALVKEGKDTLQDVFLDLQPELWNYDRTMLTLWLNPGRIKRDLIPNKEQGPPLEVGKRYQIVIKPGWHDQFHDSLVTGYQKNFVVVHRDTVSPSIDAWTITAPKAGTRDPVIVQLNEPLDYQVLKKCVSIRNPAFNEERGTREIGPGEKSWRFIPNHEWQKGKYEVVVIKFIEDLAGNNMHSLFDVDLDMPKSAGQAEGQTNYVGSIKLATKVFEIR